MKKQISTHQKPKPAEAPAGLQEMDMLRLLVKREGKNTWFAFQKR